MWLQFAVKCGYVERSDVAELYRTCDEVIRMLVGTINHPEPWLLTRRQVSRGIRE